MFAFVLLFVALVLGNALAWILGILFSAKLNGYTLKEFWNLLDSTDNKE